MTDGGILPNAALREASPLLNRALEAAVEGYDRVRCAEGREPLSESHRKALRPLLAAAVEAYFEVIGGGR
jgi:hypothetical protein